MRWSTWYVKSCIYILIGNSDASSFLRVRYIADKLFIIKQFLQNCNKTLEKPVTKEGDLTTEKETLLVRRS